MKKKAILGFMTGAAIVAATTGSYAAWDKLDTEFTYTVSVAKPVTVTTTAQQSDISNNEASRTLGEAPVYTIKTPITVAAGESHNVNLQANTEVTGITPKDTKVTVYKKDGVTEATTTDIADGEYIIETTITMPDDAPANVESATIEAKTTAKLTTDTSGN